MASDMFLKLDGISGEAKDHKHKNSIDIDSFTFSINQSGTMAKGGGGGAGKASFTDLTVMKSADKSSPALMNACAIGKHLKDALLTVRKSGGQQEEFYKIKLTDVLITSVQNSGAEGGNPTECVSLNFSKMEFDYKEQNEKGSTGGVVKFGFDLKANKAF